jgi:endonuclease-3
MLKLSDNKIKEAIKPVSFYNRKTEYIRKMSQELLDKFNGEVPQTRKELMSLTGIGRKSSDIMLRFSFGQPAIAVDTHVHRVVNRLGIAKTNNADQTADFLEQNTPEEYKWKAHEWLIKHGKYTCKAVGKPLCGSCPLQSLCDTYNKGD